MVTDATPGLAQAFTGGNKRGLLRIYEFLNRENLLPNRSRDASDGCYFLVCGPNTVAMTS